MKLNTLPIFEATLPITKKSVKFRPFVMKEEKLLLMASESKDTSDIISAIEQAVSSCSFGEVSCNTFPLVDVQYLFLAIRGKSVSENLEFNLICGGCKVSFPSFLNIEDIKVETNEKHTPVIKITEEVEVLMRYPKIQHLAILTNNEADINSVYDVITECIDSIKTPEEVVDAKNNSFDVMREFVDNLTVGQFAKLKEFFDTMPIITHTINFTCAKCEKKNVIKLDDIVNFFV